MKKALINLAKILLFFICWGVTVYIPLAIWDRPAFIGNNAALLRLWHEFEPVIAILVITLFFSAATSEDSIKIPFCKKFVPSTVFGTVLGIFWICSIIALSLMFNVIKFDTKVWVPNLWIWLLAVFANAIAQEFLVRGYIFSMLKREYNPQIATLISSIAFTILNLTFFNEKNIMIVINIFLTSVLLCLVMVYTQGIWAPILMHFMWNAIGRLCFGAVSMSDDYPMIFTTRFEGSNFITGVNGKIESSIFMLIINFILIGYILVVGSKKSINLRKHKAKQNINIIINSEDKA